MRKEYLIAPEVEFDDLEETLEEEAEEQTPTPTLHTFLNMSPHSKLSLSMHKLWLLWE